MTPRKTEVKPVAPKETTEVTNKPSAAEPNEQSAAANRTDDRTPAAANSQDRLDSAEETAPEAAEGPTAKTSYRITAAVETFNGSIADVQFKDGVAVTDNIAVISYCQGAGYTVESSK